MSLPASSKPGCQQHTRLSAAQWHAVRNLPGTYHCCCSGPLAHPPALHFSAASSAPCPHPCSTPLFGAKSAHQACTPVLRLFCAPVLRLVCTCSASALHTCSASALHTCSAPSLHLFCTPAEHLDPPNPCQCKANTSPNTRACLPTRPPPGCPGQAQSPCIPTAAPRSYQTRTATRTGPCHLPAARAWQAKGGGQGVRVGMQSVGSSQSTFCRINRQTGGRWACCAWVQRVHSWTRSLGAHLKADVQQRAGIPLPPLPLPCSFSVQRRIVLDCTPTHPHPLQRSPKEHARSQMRARARSRRGGALTTDRTLSSHHGFKTVQRSLSECRGVRSSKNVVLVAVWYLQGQARTRTHPHLLVRRGGCWWSWWWCSKRRGMRVQGHTPTDAYTPVNRGPFRHKRKPGLAWHGGGLTRACVPPQWQSPDALELG